MNKRIYFSVSIRIIAFIMPLLFIWPVIGSILGVINFGGFVQKIIFSAVFICIEIMFLGLFWATQKSFIINKDFISYKYPFLKEKRIDAKEVTGWIFVKQQYIHDFVIFLNKEKFKISMYGKNISSAIDEFIKSNYDKLVKKNMDKIRTTGIKIFIKKDYILEIKSNGIVVDDKGNKEEYSWKNVKDVSIKRLNAIYIITIIIKENQTVKFTTNQCEGGIGLLEFLSKKVKTAG